MKRTYKRNYQGLSYQELQRSNASRLTKKLDAQRKKLGLKNKGWSFIVALADWLDTAIATGGTLSDKALEALGHLTGLSQIQDDAKAAIAKLDAICADYSNVIEFPLSRRNVQ